MSKDRKRGGTKRMNRMKQETRDKKKEERRKRKRKGLKVYPSEKAITEKS